jgi:hypothetical protein
LRLCLGFPNICFNLFGSVLPITFPTTLEEVLSAIPPNPPATSKIISPLFAYCPQEFGKVIGKTDPNKLKHIFGKPKHNLNNLIKIYGSEQKAFNAIEKATQKVIKHKNIL